MRHAGMTAILLLVALGSANPARAQEPALKIPPELILERFQVNKGGDALVVPVRIAGKERLFLVDTGCSVVVADTTSMSLGEAKRVVTMMTASGEMQLKQYGAPDALVGQVPLCVDTVVGSDLQPLREALGTSIEGILGMEFLKQHVVHFDFDRGELLLLKSTPKNSGVVVPLRWNRHGGLRLEADVSSERKVEFAIDTGALGFHSGHLQAESLKRNPDFRKVGSLLSQSASGPYESSLFQGKQFTLAGFSIKEPIFQESSSVSALGLGFLSRFIVTLDFPNQKMHLRKGTEYERPDLHDQSGLCWIPRNGATVVDRVDDFSPASLAGFKEGDVLLTLGTKRVEEISPYERQKSLCIPGQLACTVRRGSHELRLTLNLPR